MENTRAIFLLPFLLPEKAGTVVLPWTLELLARLESPKSISEHAYTNPAFLSPSSTVGNFFSKSVPDSLHLTGILEVGAQLSTRTNNASQSLRCFFHSNTAAMGCK